MSEPVRYHLGAAIAAGETDLKHWTAGPTFMLPQEPDNPGHVWVVYHWDNGHRALSIHLTAEEAAREAAKTGYAHAAKWPLGTELDDAIREWVS